MHKLLIVDDEPEILETTKWAFQVAGFEVHTASNAEEALDLLYSLRPQTLLIDYKLPNLSGMEVLRAAKEMNPKAVAIMITGLTHQSEWIKSESDRLGADGFLHKPLQMDRVVKIVNELKQEE